MSSKYGLVFDDFVLTPNDVKAVKFLNTLSQLKKARFTDYPLSSINQSIWSPNRSSSHFLVNLTHSGFIRISNMKSLINFASKKGCNIVKAKSVESVINTGKVIKKSARVNKAKIESTSDNS